MKRSASRSITTLLLASGAVLVTASGCNTILDNTRGVLTETDEAGTDPSTPLDDGGTTKLPHVDSTGDAGPTTEDAGDQDPNCPSGQRTCFGACVSVNEPLYGCGNPTCAPCNVAHATAACQAGTCVAAACDKGYADCNAVREDGCETDLSRATTCGACNAVCPAATPVCAPAGGSFECSTGCTPQSPLLCGAECVDPLGSVNHCGGCNRKCANVAHATTTCTLGTCGFECQPQYHACAGACIARTDPSACGPGCTPCPVPANATATCQAEACGFQCKAGFADCNAAPADGCEVTLASDPLNCGICGRSCNGGACVNGVCGAPPPPPP